MGCFQSTLSSTTAALSDQIVKDHLSNSPSALVPELPKSSNNASTLSATLFPIDASASPRTKSQNPNGQLFAIQVTSTTSVVGSRRSLHLRSHSSTDSALTGRSHSAASIASEFARNQSTDTLSLYNGLSAFTSVNPSPAVSRASTSLSQHRQLELPSTPHPLHSSPSYGFLTVPSPRRLSTSPPASARHFSRSVAAALVSGFDTDSMHAQHPLHADRPHSPAPSSTASSSWRSTHAHLGDDDDGDSPTPSSSTSSSPPPSPSFSDIAATSEVGSVYAAVTPRVTHSTRLVAPVALESSPQISPRMSASPSAFVSVNPPASFRPTSDNVFSSPISRATSTPIVRKLKFIDFAELPPPSSSASTQLDLHQYQVRASNRSISDSGGNSVLGDSVDGENDGDERDGELDDDNDDRSVISSYSSTSRSTAYSGMHQHHHHHHPNTHHARSRSNSNVTTAGNQAVHLHSGNSTGAGTRNSSVVSTARPLSRTGSGDPALPSHHLPQVGHGIVFFNDGAHVLSPSASLKTIASRTLSASPSMSQLPLPS